MMIKKLLWAGCAVTLLFQVACYAYATEDNQVTPTAEAQPTEAEEQTTVTPTVKASPSSAAVRKANQAVDSAKEEKATMEQGLDAAKKMLSDLQGMKSKVEGSVQTLGTELSSANDQLTLLEQQLQDKIAEVVNTQKDVERAKEVEEKQYEDMKVRIKYMYEQGDTQYVSLFLESQSMADFLNKADYITSVSKYDRDMLDTFEQTRKQVEQLEEQLLKEQEELAEQQQDTKDKVAAIEFLVSAKTAELDTVTGQIASKEELIAEYEADLEEQNQIISELEAAARRAEALENSNTDGNGSSGGRQTYDGGLFAWPCPAYTRISSEFGMRMHPTLGVEKFHSGLDMAAPAGADILAAYDGTVVGADYNDSMGNYVMIAHGDGLYTIYMHASALYVTAGQKVTKGELIAAVGTTGRSTGNHLHFGVRLNGEYVDPNTYLGR